MQKDALYILPRGGKGGCGDQKSTCSGRLVIKICEWSLEFGFARLYGCE